MENLILPMLHALRKKGLVECMIEALYLIVSIAYSYVAITILKLRGYDIAYSTHIHPSCTLFQSKIHAITIGVKSDMRRNTRISAGFDGTITIGSRVLIDEGTCIMAQQNIYIGDNTLIAPYCFIMDFNHRFDTKQTSIVSQGYTRSKVIIEEDVWIGTHSIILPGVTIGRGSVIGAGSVVTKSIKPYSVVAGNPAKVIKTRS